MSEDLKGSIRSKREEDFEETIRKRLSRLKTISIERNWKISRAFKASAGGWDLI